jgi:SAM-dependent methyltransferase
VKHSDHVWLLRDGIPKQGGTWADLGCGSGAFTLALAELLGPVASIYAVDLDAGALGVLRGRVRRRFPSHDVRTIAADFTHPLRLPRLDGVLMANSLHFHEAKEPIIRSVREILGDSGRLILVEYDADHGNPWVPFPLSYSRWERLALQCGFKTTRKIGTRPSSFLREIYSAVSI